MNLYQSTSQHEHEGVTALYFIIVLHSPTTNEIVYIGVMGYIAGPVGYTFQDQQAAGLEKNVTLEGTNTLLLP